MAEVKIRGQFKIEWHDSGREPTAKPDPRFPKGRAISVGVGFGAPSCTVELPYPAKRIGFFMVDCMLCRLSLAITTAGRTDDPRSIELPCKQVLN